jgi:hypothetical protein
MSKTKVFEAQGHKFYSDDTLLWHVCWTIFDAVVLVACIYIDFAYTWGRIAILCWAVVIAIMSRRTFYHGIYALSAFINQKR